MKQSWFLIALLLTSCAGMSKKNCEEIDVYQIGLKEGQSGKPADKIRELTEACTPHGVAIQTEKYSYGRQVGLVDYCNEDRAEKDVAAGLTASVCLQEKVPPYLEAFRKAHSDQKSTKGRQLEKLLATKNELLKQEEKLKAEIRQLERQGEILPQ